MPPAHDDFVTRIFIGRFRHSIPKNPPSSECRDNTRPILRILSHGRTHVETAFT
jgi:hypothetical protein